MSSAVIHSLSSASPASRLPSPAASATAAIRRGDAMELAPGQAASLRAAREGVLRVTRGQLWVTRDATRRRATEDLVLSPGDVLSLAAGERLVMEPWDAQGAACTWIAGPGAAVSR